MSDQTTIEVVLSSESVSGSPIVETVTVVGTVPVGPRGLTGATGAAGPAGAAGAQGDPGEGVPTGGADGQVLAKASATDFDTEWVTVPTAEVTQVELDAEAAARASADAALDTRMDALEAVDPLTQTEGDARYWPLSTDLATQVELNAEAALARNADNLTSGTVADARIASSIARDSEVTAAVAAEATLRDAADTALDGRVGTLEAVSPVLSVVAGTNVTVDDTDPQNPVVSASGGGGSGVVESVVAGSNIDVDSTDPANPVVSLEALVDADIPASIARDSEVTAAVAAEATARDAAIETHRADTTGVHGITDTAALVLTDDARLSDDRDPTAHAASHENGGTDELALDASQVTSGTFADARIPAGIARDSEVAAGYQPLDADLTALAAAGNSAVLAATTAAFTTADETKLDGIEAGADVTDATNVATAGAVMEADTTTAAMGFVIDEDNMASDSATKVPTQQSVKAYVDAEVAGVGGGTLYALSPTADTYLNQQVAATNYDSATTLWIGERFDTSASFGRVALFAFDISSVAGSVVTAMLRLTRDEASPTVALSSANRLLARRVKRAFVASQVTWNIWSTGNNWATAGARGSADVETPTYTGAVILGDRDQDVWRLDLTEMVKDAVDAGDTTLRFLLGWAAATGSQNSVQVASQENATATKRPLLSVLTL